MKRVFVDGQAGTTGLALQARLERHDLITLLTPQAARRKDLEHRLELVQTADISVLCLPDESAQELVAAAPEASKILDASSAFRTAKNWVYGLPEMQPTQRDAIRSATRVSNPGCYPTAVILLLRPLFSAGLLPADAAITVFAQSGYSGGGSSLIRAYECQGGGKHPGNRPYALTDGHKHVPEMQMYSGIGSDIMFLPSVSDYYQGMLVQIPVHADIINGSLSPPAVLACWQDSYADAPLIQIATDASALPENGYLNPAGLANTDHLELSLFGNEKKLWLTARSDNLGKGAAGAAVQNLNLMLGMPELAGLTSPDGKAAYR